MDDSIFPAEQLARLEREVAAVVRQYGRAAEAGDAAQDVEAEAACDRIKWLLYHHLDLRGGLGDDNWHGWVVTCHHNDILTLVGPDEVGRDAEDLAVGLLGRSKRGQDAEGLRVLHVEDKRHAPER